MKNISENRRDKFEQAWHDAFDGKEMDPSPDLWQNLDRHLANQESKKYRRGIIVYKWIAAASVVIALMVSAVYLYKTHTTSAPGISEVQPDKESIQEQNDALHESDPTPLNSPETTLSNNATRNAAKSTNPGATGKVNSNVAQNIDKTVGAQGQEVASLEAANNKANPVDPGNNSSDSQRDPDGSQAITQLSDISDIGNTTEKDSSTGYGLFPAEDKRRNEKATDVNVLASKGTTLDHLEPKVDHTTIQKVINFGEDPFRKKEREAYEESLWAGINVSSGYFDPNFGSERGGSMDAASSVSPSVFSFDDGGISEGSVSQENSGGQSFAFGFNMGKRIAKKWVLQSGVSYLSYSSDGSTNAFYELSDQSRAPASESFSAANAESLNLASSVINYDNQFQFLSIPVKAGYVLLDKKVSLVVSAGVGTDFFLRNEVTSDDAGLQDFSVTPGGDSPYRSVYFNGLMGTQLRYRFSKHYSFTFEPSYSIAINSFSKSDSNLNSFPNVFRLGVGLKYHFR